ncbi:MAG: hypothetical protein ACLUSP_10760 [Christensenellales bacterium]
MTGIFTTMISAHLSLSEWAVSLCGNKTFAAVLTAIVASCRTYRLQNGRGRVLPDRRSCE